MDSVRRSKRWSAVLALLIGVSIIASSFLVFIQPTIAQATIIDATPYLNAAKPDYGIQAALDAAAAQGGATVQLPAGTYPLETYLHLKNGVTLQGAGDTTILKAGRNEQRVFISANYSTNASSTIKVSSVAPLRVGMIVFAWRSTALNYKPESYEITAINVPNSTITLDRSVGYPLTSNVSQVGYGLYTKLTQSVSGLNTIVKTIKVADPSIVHVGEAIMFKSTGSPLGGEGNWGVETNIVEAIDAANGTITLRNDITINAAAGSVVYHAYGAVFAQGTRSSAIRVVDIGVSNLVIEGWNTAEKPAFHEFYIGGINFVYCDRATISNVTVRYWHSDGVSLQTCSNTTVTDVTASQNRGHGFHPGTGSKYVEFLRIQALGNLGLAFRGTAGDGLFYCWSNQYVNIRQSTLSDNAGSGVGDLGGGDTNNTSRETNNLIEDSTMERNGRAGIEITGGGDQTNTTIQRNTIRNNNRNNADYAGIQISAKKGDSQRFTIINNLVESSANPATQFVGVRETNLNGYTANYNSIRDNTVLNHTQGNIITLGAQTVVANNNTGTAPTATTSPTATTPAQATATAPSQASTATATSVAPTATTAPSANQVISLTLYNADTDQPIAGFNPMPANSTLDFAALGTRNLSIRANTSPTTVGSVRFSLDGASYRVETLAPYTIAGEATSTNYNPWTPSLGAHTLSGIAYTGGYATGTPGATYTITFNVVDGVAPTATTAPPPTATNVPPPTATATTLPGTPQVLSLTLFNADTDQSLAGFDPLPSDATLNFAALGTRNLSIRANTNLPSGGSVRFWLDGATFRMENAAPYAINGDTAGPNYTAWTPTVGTHTLEVTAYSAYNGGGSASAVYTVTLTVRDN